MNACKLTLPWPADLLGAVSQRLDAEIMHGEQAGTSVRVSETSYQHCL